MIISNTAQSGLANGSGYFSVQPLKLAAPPDTPSFDQGPQDGVASLRGTGMNLAGNVIFINRGVPTVDLTSPSLSNALSVQDTAHAIESQKYPAPVDLKLNYGSRSLSVQGQLFSDIYSSLLSVRAKSAALQNSSTYNTKKASSGNAAVASATAGQNTPTGGYKVTVSRLARGETLASSVVTNPGLALGLSGTIKVNGWQTSVTASDTLFTIRDKINYGEDTNHNGTLDSSADVNGNDRLDVLTAAGAFDGSQYLPSFYLNEASIGNGTLSPSEDTNNNKILDGGSAQTGVKASVSNGQLVLQSLDGGNINLRLEDPNGILERLGVLFRGSNNQVAQNFLNSQSVRAQTAEFSVNGTANQSPSNDVHNGVGGLKLSLKSAGTTTVTVTNDTAKAVRPVEDFAGSFNGAMDLLNATIGGTGALSDNAKLQNIYADMVRTLYTPTAAPAGGMLSVADLGISAVSGPGAIQQLALEQVPSIMQEPYDVSGTGPEAWLAWTSKRKVDSLGDFKIGIDAARMEKKLTENNAGVKDMLALAAGRLQSRLDRHLQPDYGTISFQQQVIAAYSSNQADVAKLMAETAGVTGNAITAESSNTLFFSLESQKNTFRPISVKV